MTLLTQQKTIINMNSNNLKPMLMRIINDNGNYITKDQASECLKELNNLEGELRISRLIISEINTISKTCLNIYKNVIDEKSNT